MLGTNAELAAVVALSDFDRDLKATAKQLGQSSSGRLYNLRRDLGAAAARALAREVLVSDRRLKSGEIRDPRTQLLEIMLRRAQKTRA